MANGFDFTQLFGGTTPAVDRSTILAGQLASLIGGASNNPFVEGLGQIPVAMGQSNIANRAQQQQQAWNETLLGKLLAGAGKSPANPTTGAIGTPGSNLVSSTTPASKGSELGTVSPVNETGPTTIEISPGPNGEQIKKTTETLQPAPTPKTNYQNIGDYLSNPF